MPSKLPSFITLLLLWGGPGLASPQIHPPGSIRMEGREVPLYPGEMPDPPGTESPFRTDDGMEILVVRLENGRFALIPVTVEHGDPLVYSTRIEDLYGKDDQLAVSAGDFPTLARTGLHSEAELDGKEMITGFPVSLITYIGRPGRFSRTGFMAEDEDILSVLKGDNRLVTRLGLTHPEMARPLFHVWNLILHQMNTRAAPWEWDDVAEIHYNGQRVRPTVEGGRGWQISIFQDEIKGRFNLDVHCDLSEDQKAFLGEKYPRLSASQREEMEERLSHIHFSEMAPYYIMRYGFYEGHTGWRTDPIAIAFVFGLKTLQAIEEAFAGELYEALTRHHSEEGA